MNDDKNLTTEPIVNGENNGTNSHIEPIETPATKSEVNDPVTTNNGGYVKERVERAKKQTTDAILKELGANSIEDVKNIMNTGLQALNEVKELKEKLEKQEHAEELFNKKKMLIKILEEQKVFDADALVNYVDLEKIKVENNEIVDSENIINSLKKAKPNFFGTSKVTGDNYLNGQANKVQSALEKQKNGNIVGAIDDYLKSILK